MPDQPQNSAAALDGLRELIRDLTARGERRLPTERVLAKSLGVGRRALRQALEVLETEGRLWRQQGKGTFLGPRPDEPSEMARILSGETNFYDVMEARLRLEPQLAFLAALKASDAQVARMRAICQRIAECEDADACELWDGALHRQIARATGNRLLLGFFDVIEKIHQNETWTVLRARARHRGTRAEYVGHHAVIVDAIAARDPCAAKAAMRRHIVALQQNLILAMEGAQSAAE